MRLYRFSPINNEQQLREAIKHVHAECFKLCHQVFGEYLPAAGNIGIFCHYEDEYHTLVQLREKLTESSDNINQKYYRLHDPIVIPAEGDVPGATYTYLYIRQPDPYRAQVGDVDLVMDPDRYASIKKTLADGKVIPGARLFPRVDLDMIELHDPSSDALAYVSVRSMTEKVRIKPGTLT